jgi:predicted DsbA family dithiol-disulfide isomerase
MKIMAYGMILLLMLSMVSALEGGIYPVVSPTVGKSIGPSDAPVHIEWFASPGCPFCAQWYEETFPDIMNEYEGDVRVSYHHFPLSFHENSMEVSFALECAGKHGIFWEYIDRTIDDKGMSRNELLDLAEDYGIDIDEFDDCMRLSSVESAVESDIEYAQEMNVQGTPYFFVNGKPLVGSQSFNAFADVIDEFLDDDLPPPPSGAHSGSLEEGETQVYWWDGKEYEITLAWVSDALYWEDPGKTTASAPSLDNQPSAKFIVNGDTSDSLHPGEKDEVACGTLKVESIGNRVTSSGDTGIVDFLFYPGECYNGDFVKLHEGDHHLVTLNGINFKILLERVDDHSISVEVYRNGEGVSTSMHVGEYETVNGLRFLVKDADEDAEWAYIGDFSVVDDEPTTFEGTLKEGETKLYLWNGKEYELTVIFVSDPYYWEESKTADIATGPTARFLLNGDFSDYLGVGDKDQMLCGDIRVTEIYSEGRDGKVSYIFYPSVCGQEPPGNEELHIAEGETTVIEVEGKEFEISALRVYGERADFLVNGLEGNAFPNQYASINGLKFYVYNLWDATEVAVLGKFETYDYVPPEPGDGITDTLREGECQTYGIVGYEMETCLKEVRHDSAGVPCYEDSNGNTACADIARPYAWFRINGDVDLRVYEGMTETFTFDNFHGKLYVKDIDQEWEGGDKVTFNLDGSRSVPNPVVCSADAKRCADGSYVGRVGPNCEFADCPIAQLEACEDGGHQYCDSTGRCDCYYDTDDIGWDAIDSWCPDGQRVCYDDGSCECYQTNMPYPESYYPGEDPSVEPTLVCNNGCELNGKCVDFGMRYANGEKRYCSLEGWALQKSDGTSCQNSYECESNQCSSGACVDLVAQVRENTSLLQRITNLAEQDLRRQQWIIGMKQISWNWRNINPLVLFKIEAS